MTKSFYIFGPERADVELALRDSGWSLDEIMNTFNQPPWIKSEVDHNNPWRLYDADGGEVSVPYPGNKRGYAVPLQGEDETVASLFNSLRDNEAARRVVGVEFAPVLQVTAPAGLNWCGGHGKGAGFGDRRAMRRIIGAEALETMNLTGDGVRVFVVDQGLLKSHVEDLGGTYGGGLAWFTDNKVVLPGNGGGDVRPAPSLHTSMLLRSVLDLAPDAVIYDLPLIPRRIVDVTGFAAAATLAYYFLSLVFLFVPPPWIVLNAWGIRDRFGETFWGEYTNNADHPFNLQVQSLGNNHDVIFAAGNSGQFCPDPSAGPYDRGPGRSILGANGHPSVISVGAARPDAHWIGASSQGPGPGDFAELEFETRKPDLCAPSWFSETRNRGQISTGTSAASAVVAGAVAALRQQWAAPSPAVMRDALNAGARPMGFPGWTGRVGHGLLNLPGAIENLPR